MLQLCHDDNTERTTLDSCHTKGFDCDSDWPTLGDGQPRTDLNFPVLYADDARAKVLIKIRELKTFLLIFSIEICRFFVILSSLNHRLWLSLRLGHLHGNYQTLYFETLKTCSSNTLFSHCMLSVACFLGVKNINFDDFWLILKLWKHVHLISFIALYSKDALSVFGVNIFENWRCCLHFSFRSLTWKLSNLLYDKDAEAAWFLG